MTLATVDMQAAVDLDRRVDELGLNFVEALAEVYRTGAWLTLGYASWDDYLATKGDLASRRIPAADRLAVFGPLREAGMSDRQIAATVGVNNATVSRSFSVANATENDLDAEPDIDAEPDTAPPPKPAPPKPAAPPHRKPLPDSFWRIVYDIGKSARTLAALTEDDRFQSNAEKVATKNRGDLVRTRDLLTKVIDSLPLQEAGDTP